MITIDCKVTANERAFPTTIFVASSRKIRQLFVECSIYLVSNTTQIYVSIYLISNINQIYVSKGIQSGHCHGFHSLLSDLYDRSGFYFANEVASGLAFALKSGIGHIGYKPGLVYVIHQHKNTCGRTWKCNCVFSDLKIR